MSGIHSPDVATWRPTSLFLLRTTSNLCEESLDLRLRFGRKGRRIDLIDVAGVADNDHPHHAHCGMRRASKYVDAGLNERHVEVLAEIGVEGLGLRRDHAGNRVDFVSFINSNEVNGVTRLDADQLRIKDKESVRSMVQFLHLEFFAE